MSLPKGTSNSGIKNLVKFQKGASGFHFKERDVVCVTCSSAFKTTGPLAKYCSKKCKEQNRPEKQKKKFYCEFCNTSFLRRAPSNAGRFCSRSCSGMWLIANGKKNYFYQAFLHKPHQCNRCGIEDYELLCVHHIDFNHNNNAIDNLEILCANCHYRIHFGRGRTRKDKLSKIIEYLRRKNAVD